MIGALFITAVYVLAVLIKVLMLATVRLCSSLLCLSPHINRSRQKAALAESGSPRGLKLRVFSVFSSSFFFPTVSEYLPKGNSLGISLCKVPWNDLFCWLELYEWKWTEISCYVDWQMGGYSVITGCYTVLISELTVSRPCADAAELWGPLK